MGEPNRGFYSIMANFQTERLVIGAMAMAEAPQAIRLTYDHVSQRTPSASRCGTSSDPPTTVAPPGRGRAARQLVQSHRLLDAQGQDCVAQVSMVKALAGDLVNQVLYDCVQFHGGMGFMRETAVERMARDARVQAIGGGASEVMLEEIAKRFGAVSGGLVHRSSFIHLPRMTGEVHVGAISAPPGNGPTASSMHPMPPVLSHSADRIGHRRRFVGAAVTRADRAVVGDRERAPVSAIR